jgi:diguanylate cyclase (GGDEF)-like protein/PAS domain S-box-containing protein
MDASTTKPCAPVPVNASLASDFRAWLDGTDEAVLVLREGLILDANPAACRLFGLEDVAARRYPENLSPPRQPDGHCSFGQGREILAQAERLGNYRFDWLHAAPAGPFWAEVVLTRVTCGGATLLYALVRDISARKQAEHTLKLAAQVFELGREAVLIADSARRIVSVNRAFCDVTGHDGETTCGRLLHEILCGMHDDAQCRLMFEAAEARGYWEGEVWDRRRNGQIYPQWLTLTAVPGPDGAVSHYIAVFSDISERKSLEERTRHMAEHDFLTGLPNRILLIDRVSQAIASSRRNGTQFALLFLDLDRFKFVNDSMGHHIGDRLLQEVARRLKKCVRAIDTVSRQGGDEFIILLADIGLPKQVARIAQNVMDEVGRTCAIDGHEFSVTACIGISTYPNDGDDIDTLLQHADIAMYYAKESGRNGFQFFSDEMNARIRERSALEHTLRQALEREEFLLHYQPAIDFASGRVVGAEALIRWDHPEKGRLLPTRFIAAAEECGLTVDIGQWVLRSACIQARRWRDQGFALVVSVNLSTAQFRHKDLAKNIAAILDASGLEPGFLELELTEGVLHGMDNAADVIAALKRLGVRLSIDDFGTGYSSLGFLRRFRLDTLKIDRSLVQDISGECPDGGLVRAMVAMAKSLSMQVVAEGVETEQQFGFLRSIGCDTYQGHYACPPLPGVGPNGFLPAFSFGDYAALTAAPET